MTPLSRWLGAIRAFSVLGVLKKNTGTQWVPITKGFRAETHEAFIFLARLKGFEPLTHGLEVRCSIRLSYRRID
jgi:hypothetical protein